MNSKTKEHFIQQLPLLVKTITDTWNTLLRQEWSQEKAEALFDLVHDFTEQSEQFGENEVSDYALSLEVYLSSLMEHDFIQNKKQVNEVTRLLQHVHDACHIQLQDEKLPLSEQHLSFTVAKVVQEDLVYVLQRDELDIPAWKDRYYQFKSVHTEAALYQLLAVTVPCALIIDSEVVVEQDVFAKWVQAIRKKYAIRLPLVFVMSYYSIQKRLEIMRMGADAHFSIPIQTDIVIEQIQKLLEEKNTHAWKVMIIDDDQAQAKFAQRILAKSGLITDIVNQPLDALDAMKTFQPDLILMDIYMPECNGLELTQIIREDKQWLDTPIIFLSGEHDPDKQFDALSVGGDDFLAKPISPKHLISAVTTRMQRITQIQKKSAVMTDVSTGKMTRTQFLNYLNKDNLKGLLIYYEIDHIPELIKYLGIDAVEILLQQVADILLEIEQKNIILTQFSEYTFFVLLPEMQQDIDSLIKASLTQVSEHLFDIEGKTTTLTMTAGAYLLEGIGNKNQWISYAQSGLLEARNKSKQYVIYQPVINIATSQEKKNDTVLLEIIDTALQKNLITLLYQAIIGLHGENIEQYQVLFVIEDAKGNRLDMQDILSVYRAAGRIHLLERWLYTKILQLLEKQPKGRSTYLLLPHWFSPDKYEGFLYAFEKLEHKFRKGLMLEFTYGNLTQDIKASHNYVLKLQQLGMRTAIVDIPLKDNIATILQHLPVNFIRLQANDVSKDDLLLNSIMNLAHKQNKKVIISKVDEARKVVALWSANVDYIQGDFLQPATETLCFDFSSSIM